MTDALKYSNVKTDTLNFRKYRKYAVKLLMLDHGISAQKSRTLNLLLEILEGHRVSFSKGAYRFQTKRIPTKAIANELDVTERYVRTRDPLPEILRGVPDQTRNLIDTSTNKWSYTSGVISFADSDQPNESEQQEAIDRFEELGYAGLGADQYDCLWVRHVHEGNVELHFCTPRLELTEGKSLNIAPPGHEAAFSSLRDLLNQEHHWADPLEADRARQFKLVRESAERAEARSVIIGAIYDQIDGGLITDRQTMIEFIEDAGFEITRRAKKSISVRDPEFIKPFKLEGVLTHENWTTDKHKEIAADHQVGTDANRPKRLDEIPHEQLCAELARHIEKRGAYNRERYGQIPSKHMLDHREQVALDAKDLSLRTLDNLVDGFYLDGDTDWDQPDVELADAPNANGRLWFDQGDDKRPDLSGFEPQPDQVSELHNCRQADHLSGGAEIDDTTSTNSIGARIAWLCGAVDQVVNTVREGNARFGKALDLNRAPISPFDNLCDALGCHSR